MYVQCTSSLICDPWPWCMYVWCIYLWSDACTYDAHLYDAHIYDPGPWSWFMHVYDAWIYIWCSKFVTDGQTDKPILGVGYAIPGHFWRNYFGTRTEGILALLKSWSPFIIMLAVIMMTPKAAVYVWGCRFHPPVMPNWPRVHPGRGPGPPDRLSRESEGDYSKSLP